MRGLAAVTRRLLWIAAVGLLALALYVSLGRQLVPLLAEYRAEVQAQAQAALRMPLRIGRLEGRWERFSPRLIAHDVQLGEGEGGVRLERITAVVDVFESLWSRRPTLYALEVQGVRLDLREAADGHWQVTGLPLPGGGPALDPQPVLEALQRLARITLLDAQLTLGAFGEAPRTLTYLDLELTNRMGRWRLDGRALLPDGQPLALSAQASLRPDDWRAAELQAYLRIPRRDWADWLPARLTRDWRIEQWLAGGELWLDWRRQGLERAVLRLDAPALAAAHGQQAAARLTDLAVTAYLQRQPDGYGLLLDGLTFRHGEQHWSPSRLGLVRQARNAAPDLWRGWAERIELAPLVPLAKALAPLPDKAVELLDTLQPHGMLRNVRVEYDPAAEAGERLRYAANLARVGSSAWHWVPAFENASGLLQGTLEQGELRLASDDFALQLAPLYPEPWHYHRAGGRLTWRLDEQAFTLVAPYLRIDGEEGRIAGDFLIRLFRDGVRENYMDLRVGLQDGDARFTGRYLPTRSPALSPALAEWLQGAIRGGHIEQGYFQYQGSIKPGTAPESRQIGLYFRVRDAELDYRPGWPALREGRGEVQVENSGTQVVLTEGHLLNSRVYAARAQIPHVGEGQSPHLLLQGTVEGPLADGLTVLREAPLDTGGLFEGWRAEGDLQARLDLDIPLAKAQRPHVVVEFSSQDALLDIPSPALRFERLTGAFRYDSEQGLSATEVRARLLDHEVNGRAVAIGRDGNPATRIEARGTVGVTRLGEWLGAGGTLPVSGELPYRMRVTLAGAASQLQVDSSLLGTVIELPEPFGKPADLRRDTSLRLTLQGPERRYTVQHADVAALAFAAPANDWRQGRGELRLGGEVASLPDAPGLRVSGTLATLDPAAWRTALRRHDGDGAGQGMAGTLLRSAEVRVARLQGFGPDIEDLALRLDRQGEAWRLEARSAAIAGQLLRPDEARAPWVLTLDHLRLPAADEDTAGAVPAEERPDPLADVDPSTLPALDASIREVWQGDRRLGRWRLTLRPVPGGVAFRELDMELNGLTLAGSGRWAEGRSRYEGRIQGGNLAEVLAAWGFAPSATSERFSLAAAGDWPGSPAWFAMRRFSGSLDATLQRGQFVEVEGGAQALRVFGLLNFNAIGRRLRLDFSDLLGRGLSYDRVEGRLVADKGVYVTQGPLSLTGPSSNLELNGQLDMVNDRIDARLLVTLPVTNNLPLAALIVGAPAVGGALWVADRLLGDKVARFATVQYRVEGPWQAPEITFDKPFERPD